MISQTRPIAKCRLASTLAITDIRQRTLYVGELQQALRKGRLAAKEPHMATNLALDQELLERAFVLSGEPTKKAAVTLALQEFIARREQRRVADLFGKLDWDASYDYKAERSR